MEIKICAGYEKDTDFPEVGEIEVEDIEKGLAAFLSGRELLDLIRKNKEDEDISILGTMYDPDQNILFAQISTIARSEQIKRWQEQERFSKFGISQ